MIFGFFSRPFSFRAARALFCFDPVVLISPGVKPFFSVAFFFYKHAYYPPFFLSDTLLLIFLFACL